MLLTMNPRGVTPLLETRANELNAAISPDGTSHPTAAASS